LRCNSDFLRSRQSDGDAAAAGKKVTHINIILLSVWLNIMTPVIIGCLLTTP
jgi:hypothetical protein